MMRWWISDPITRYKWLVKFYLSNSSDCELWRCLVDTLLAVGFSYSERERNHCEQPFAFPSNMREFVLPHVMHHLIVSVYFRDLSWKLLFALRNRFISVYRTRKQRDLSIYSKRGEKVQRFTVGKFPENPKIVEFFKKVNRSAEILEISKVWVHLARLSSFP